MLRYIIPLPLTTSAANVARRNGNVTSFDGFCDRASNAKRSFPRNREGHQTQLRTDVSPSRYMSSTAFGRCEQCRTECFGICDEACQTQRNSSLKPGVHTNDFAPIHRRRALKLGHASLATVFRPGRLTFQQIPQENLESPLLK